MSHAVDTGHAVLGLSFSSLLGFVLALHVFDGKLCCGGKERRKRGNENVAKIAEGNFRKILAWANTARKIKMIKETQQETR